MPRNEFAEKYLRNAVIQEIIHMEPTKAVDLLCSLVEKKVFRFYMLVKILAEIEKGKGEQK